MKKRTGADTGFKDKDGNPILVHAYVSDAAGAVYYINAYSQAVPTADGVAVELDRLMKDGPVRVLSAQETLELNAKAGKAQQPEAKFFFCDYISIPGARASEVEKHLLAYAVTRFQHRIFLRVELETALRDLDQTQTVLISAYPSRQYKRVKVKLEETDKNIYFFLGSCALHIRFVPVLGTEKGCRASELFNDGWWNCLETFSMEASMSANRYEMDIIISNVLWQAGVSSTEAYIRAAVIGDPTVQQIVRAYADNKFQFGQ